MQGLACVKDVVLKELVAALRCQHVDIDDFEPEHGLIEICKISRISTHQSIGCRNDVLHGQDLFIASFDRFRRQKAAVDHGTVLHIADDDETKDNHQCKAVARPKPLWLAQ